MLIKNATIFSMDKHGNCHGDILIRNGKITQIASSIDLEQEEIFDANGQIITPGFIDTSSHLGLASSGMRWEGNEIEERSENNLSNLSVINAFNPFDETIQQACLGGITTAIVTSGEASSIGAKSAAIKTTGKPVEQCTISTFCDLSVTFGNHAKRLNDRGEFPRSRMGIVSILRSAYEDANLYNKSKKQQDFLDNEHHEAMLKVIHGEVPLKIVAYTMQDILTAIRLQKELQCRVILNQCTEGWKVLDEISEASIPVIVGNYLKPIGDYAELNRNMSCPALLADCNIPFAFSSHTQDVGYGCMAINAALMVNYGLSEAKALSALTIDSARMFGLDNRIGSITENKDADLLLWDGHPLFSMSKIQKVMIDGTWINK